MITFHMPPAPATAFAPLARIPRWLSWFPRLLEQWGLHTTFELSPTTLRIRGTLYGRRIPRTVLTPEAARAADPRTEPTLKPIVRTNGIGLPGYGAGWFRLASGERALAFLTDPDRIIYVPTRAGYSLLLSVDDPSGFLATLRDGERK